MIGGNGKGGGNPPPSVLRREKGRGRKLNTIGEIEKKGSLWSGAMKN